MTIVSAGIINAPDSTVIDDFNDESLGEYSGDTGSFSFDTTTTFEGAASLTSTNGSNPEILSTSGLDNYPAQGDTFSWYTRTSIADGGSGGEARFYFGVQNSSNQYYLRFRPDVSQIVLRRNVATSHSTLDVAAITGGIAANTWYKCECVWTVGNQITIDVYDSADETTSLAQVDVNDSSFTDGGVGMQPFLDGTGDQVWWDNATIA